MNHPLTFYGFLTALVALIGLIVLLALHDVTQDVAVPIIAALAVGGVGAGAGIAQQNKP